MAERTKRKIPVTERQFLWVQDDDKGEVILHVGPTMVSPTAADRVVIDDGQGGFREDTSGQPQKMIELSDNQYAVLFNPLLENDGGPNGRFRTGRNEARPLQNGTRAMIPGPCSFYLRPGQRVEIRDAHELSSDQYLVVKVYGEVDKSAPFYEITARSAGITHATEENVADDAKGASTRLEDLKPVELRRGQLIVIRGLDTQFYIPPTGVDIVPDTSVDDSGATLSANMARQILAQLPPPPQNQPQSIRVDKPPQEEEALEYARAISLEKNWDAEEQSKEEFIDEEQEEYDEFQENINYRKQSKGLPAKKAKAPAKFGRAREEERERGTSTSARDWKRVQKPPAPKPAPEEKPRSEAASMLEDLGSIEAVRRALEKEARQARLIRRAVVLGEKEYCVVIDADGKRTIKVGPARVFPGPYDTFMTRGSRKRVYDAYELLPQRALWLRVIAPIKKEDLQKKLPRGFQLEEDKEFYFPGDELLLTGVSTFFFPFNEIEVLSPETGEAVVGNDHSRVFIEAIGIDQRSGIYVRDLATGEVRLIKGKRSYLVDPRKEVQITRTIPADDWNLWVAAISPHKYTTEPKTPPWALSITVPHNMAVLATSAAGQRVIEGPCATLLEYEERLVPLLLSTGTPKSDANPLRTCFLQVRGNRVSDVITVETGDFVKISITVSYLINFLQEYKDLWFNHENYIQVLVDHLRSLVRGKVRNLSFSAVWPQLPSLIRDTILGERTSEGRPGKIFPENGMAVTEVEVLSLQIEDRRIAELMQKVQTDSVMLQLGDRLAKESLQSARLRDEIDQQRQEIATEAREREARLRALEQSLRQEARLSEIRDQEALALEKQTLKDAHEAAALKARLQREAEAKEGEWALLQKDALARAEAKRLVDAAQLEKEQKITELTIRLREALSAATVAERKAVQEGLVEAMTALGDKIMLSEVAQNMNLVSLFKGKDVGTILAEILGGTPVMPTVKALLEKFGDPKE